MRSIVRPLDRYVFVEFWKIFVSTALGFPLLRDRDGSVSKTWKAKLLPASYLIGRDGRIHYVAYGELDWSSDAVRARVAELLQ